MLPSDPLTLTWVAFVATIVSVDELPTTMLVGFAVMVMVGAGFPVTVTVVDAETLPPEPVAVVV